MIRFHEFSIFFLADKIEKKKLVVYLDSLTSLALKQVVNKEK